MEKGIINHNGDASWGSRIAASSSFSFEDGSSSHLHGHENELSSEYLHIQMEYCPRFYFYLTFHSDSNLSPNEMQERRKRKKQ